MAKKKKEETRGRKHPEGFTKSGIFLLALDYPDGIKEPDLVEEIRNKLGIKDVKGIKGHLADLGEGRKIPGREKGEKRKEGKHYLIKEAQLGEANIWKPNPDFSIFREMALDTIVTLNLAVPFMRTEYTQRMVKEHVFDMIEKKFGIDLSTGEPAVEYLKNMILRYPTALRYFLGLLQQAEEGETEAIRDFPDFIKETSVGPVFSAARSILPTRGQDAVGVLDLVLGIHILMELNANPEWRNMFDDEDLAKLGRFYEIVVEFFDNRPDVKEKLKNL